MALKKFRYLITTLVLSDVFISSLPLVPSVAIYVFQSYPAEHMVHGR